MTVLVLALAGGIGALVRFEIGCRVTGIAGWFPAGTFIVNVTGSFLTGLLAGAHLSDDAALILGSGFLGGFTTFSTWMVETVALASNGRRVAAFAVNLLGMLALGVAGAWWGSSI